MGAEQAPKCTNDAHSVHALMNEMKSLLSPSVLENGAVLVGLLPKHRCCAGSCHAVETRENMETRENEKIRDIKEIQETKEAQEIKHNLEGIWEVGNSLILIHTVQGKQGYLFGTLLIGDSSLYKKVIFWVRSGNGMSTDTLEGKVLQSPSTWLPAKLRLCADNTLDLLWPGDKVHEKYTRWQSTNASQLLVDSGFLG